MKERPILFSGPMVRAILEGRKTVTRRAIKHQPDVPVTDAIPRRNYPHGPATVDWYWRPQHGHLNGVPSNGWDFKCPYGQPGDRLWVRESCQAEEMISGEDGVRYLADDVWMMIKDDSQSAIAWLRLYTYGKDKGRTVPSIHMPRWACRILLEITDVRVERLQDISSAQAEAEGVDRPENIRDVDVWDGAERELFNAMNQPRDRFKRLWADINGAESWDANPWVWVVEFKRVEAASV